MMSRCLGSERYKIALRELGDTLVGILPESRIAWYGVDW